MAQPDKGRSNGALSSRMAATVSQSAMSDREYEALTAEQEAAVDEFAPQVKAYLEHAAENEPMASTVSFEAEGLTHEGKYYTGEELTRMGLEQVGLTPEKLVRMSGMAHIKFDALKVGYVSEADAASHGFDLYESFAIAAKGPGERKASIIFGKDSKTGEKKVYFGEFFPYATGRPEGDERGGATLMMGPKLLYMSQKYGYNKVHLIGGGGGHGIPGGESLEMGNLDMFLKSGKQWSEPGMSGSRQWVGMGADVVGFRSHMAHIRAQVKKGGVQIPAQKDANGLVHSVYDVDSKTALAALRGIKTPQDLARNPVAFAAWSQYVPVNPVMVLDLTNPRVQAGLKHAERLMLANQLTKGGGIPGKDGVKRSSVIGKVNPIHLTGPRPWTGAGSPSDTTANSMATLRSQVVELARQRLKSPQ